ncbi:C-type lectin domain family 17, member A isoform X3 [Ictidomys tridecemlineatus]
MAPPYKDLPPKPDSMAPPRPPRAGEWGWGSRAPPVPLHHLGLSNLPPSPGKKPETPPLPSKPLRMTALGLPPVPRKSHQLGVDREPPPVLPSLTTTPVPWLHPKSKSPGCHQEERLKVYLYLLLLGTSLILSCLSLTVTLTKYQEVVERLGALTSQQAAWQVNVTGMAGLAGLKKDIDRVRADTNQSLVELRGLLDCTRITCPEGWLPFEGRCYYFSPSTKSWDEARKFCQENYSHLVIINSFAEHNFVAKAHGSPRVYWLGLNDKNREGDWRWLDGSPVTLSFWAPQEPNNIYEEDCASMNNGGTWNDLSCAKTTYWICERKCSC